MHYTSWDEYYAIAKDLFAKTGSINVSARFVYNGIKIGEWIHHQRAIERKNGLKSDRKKKLDQLNINWDGRDVAVSNRRQSFLDNFALLKEYKDTYGDTRIPRAYRVNGVALGTWAASIRESMRGNGKRKLTEEQIQMLSSIGFEYDWYRETNEEVWETYYELVDEYCKIHGVDAIIQSTDYKGYRIGNWIHTQRVAYKKGLLHSARVSKLESLGVSFAPADERWNMAFSLATKYYSEFGNLNVPNDFIVDGFNLGRWISNQRQVHKGSRNDMIISDEQCRKLESIGMIWKSNNATNTSFIEQAFFYYIKKELPDTKSRDKTFGIELDIFIPSKKIAIEYDGSYWHDNKLEKDNYKDDVCYDNGVRLIRIREEPLPPTKSAYCYFTSNKNDNCAITRIIKNVLSEQLGINSEIDLSKDCFSIVKAYGGYINKQWNNCYNEAVKYYETYGNLLVPTSFVTADGVKLGSWISNQRCAYKGTAYGHLSNEQIKLLDQIGMIWNVREAKWFEFYMVAREYFDEFGNLLVKRNCFYHGVELGKWINTQRNAYNNIGRRHISTERIRLLESIGMVWKTR